MADIYTKEERSKIMASVKSKSTMPEIIIRKKLFKEGYRFRLNQKSLPGKPDIVLKKYSTVIFVNGCFWHQHNCKKGKIPKQNHDFWESKLNSNKSRDKEIIQDLINMGWRVCVVWECSINNDAKLNECVYILLNFISSDQIFLEI